MDFVANVREMVVLMIAVVAARAVSSWLAILEGGGPLDGVTVRIVHDFTPAWVRWRRRGVRSV